MNVSNTIEKGRQLWSSIDQYIVDTVEVLEEDAVESLIGQSTSLRFVGLDCSLLLPSSINS
jgi:hypothetical protein